MTQQELADKAAITEALHNWGLWRDGGRWQALRDLYTSDAQVHTTWFVGSATEFVERSMAAARKSDRRVQHFIGASSIELARDKAIAETRVILLARGTLHGALVDITCYSRFYDWFVRQGEKWRIRMRGGIYEKDRLDAVDPHSTPKLDAAELAKYPEAYRHLAYLQASAGASITPDLPAPGSDALARLYAEGESWLRSAEEDKPWK